jgi:carboxylate-amine ligase
MTRTETAFTPTTVPAPPATRISPAVTTLGVEEEFLLLDPDTGHNAPVAEQVIANLPEAARAQSRLEFRRSMIEMVTPVCGSLTDVRRSLSTLRRAAANAAAAAGARLVAAGACPLDDPPHAIVDKPRYRAITEHYGPIATDPACCGCHVHVGVPDRELAVQVCNRLRSWLPVIQAMTANSPIHNGEDTGHASWRCMQLTRWPSMGPTPHFASADEYDRTVASLIASGVALDPSMIYWYARPSANYPTVEVRVGDVCPTVADTVLIAGLIRALVTTVIEDIRAGVPALEVRDCLLTAAHWHAAHQGLDDTLLDPRQGRTRPAWECVDELVAFAEPGLRRHGDRPLILREVARLRTRGTGAARQRRVHRRTGDIHAVLADLHAQTTGR